VLCLLVAIASCRGFRFLLSALAFGFGFLASAFSFGFGFLTSAFSFGFGCYLWLQTLLLPFASALAFSFCFGF
jgi:hypothetical protein